MQFKLAADVIAVERQEPGLHHLAYPAAICPVQTVAWGGDHRETRRSDPFGANYRWQVSTIACSNTREAVDLYAGVLEVDVAEPFCLGGFAGALDRGR